MTLNDNSCKTLSNGNVLSVSHARCQCSVNQKSVGPATHTVQYVIMCINLNMSADLCTAFSQSQQCQGQAQHN